MVTTTFGFLSESDVSDANLDNEEKSKSLHTVLRTLNSIVDVLISPRFQLSYFRLTFFVSATGPDSDGFAFDRISRQRWRRTAEHVEVSVFLSDPNNYCYRITLVEETMDLLECPNTAIIDLQYI